MSVYRFVGDGYGTALGSPQPSTPIGEVGDEVIDLNTGARLIECGQGLGLKPILPVSSVGGAPVTPTRAGVLTPFFLFGNSAASIDYFKVVLNATDDASAGVRLAQQYPGVMTFLPATSYPHSGWQPIVRADVVAVASAADTAGGLVTTASNAAANQSNMKTFVFDPEDNVLLVDFQACVARSSNVHVNIQGVGYV